jgi:hypothetical protein
VLVRTEGNSRKARTAVTRSGCRRGEFFEGCTRREAAPARPEGSNPPGWWTAAKRGEHPTGSGAQQIRDPQVEKAVQAVRNCEGGTRQTGGTVGPKGTAKAGSREWTPEAHVGGDEV